MVIRGLADQRREAIKEQLAEAFAPCTVDGGYELPGVSSTPWRTKSPSWADCRPVHPQRARLSRPQQDPRTPA
jgi:hypothetical protein